MNLRFITLYRKRLHPSCFSSWWEMWSWSESVANLSEEGQWRNQSKRDADVHGMGRGWDDLYARSLLELLW